MLQSLIIKNFVIVEHLELNFKDGFTVFTGETGAGKSMIIDALALLLGKRATTLKIRQGTERAEISAYFKITSPELKENLSVWCNELGFDFDSDEIFIRRVIERSGKSRAWINGHNSSVNQVREIGETLMEIHSQNAHQKLLTPDYQRKILDDFSNIKTEVELLKNHWINWNETKEKRCLVEKKSELLNEKITQLNWKISILEKLNLQKNEWQDLSTKEKKFSSIAEILEIAEEALNSIQNNENSIISKIEKLQNKVTSLIDKDQFFEKISKSLELSLIELKDITDDLGRYVNQNDLDPYSFEQISERVSEIFNASQKIGCKPENLDEVLKDSRNELSKIKASNDLDILKDKEKEYKKNYDELAKFVSEKRVFYAKNFQVLVSEWFKKLSMENIVFYIDISKKETISSSGTDEINFLIKHIASEKALKINRVASGGELSRISLAISVVMANSSKTPSLIFDEVDSGIGGNTAHTVGKLLKLLGEDQQIICVTHLPQVAACGHSHFSILKVENNDLPSSKVTEVKDAERVAEIARMLGTEVQLHASLNHAKALLNQ